MGDVIRLVWSEADAVAHQRKNGLGPPGYRKNAKFGDVRVSFDDFYHPDIVVVLAIDPGSVVPGRVFMDRHEAANLGNALLLWSEIRRRAWEEK